MCFHHLAFDLQMHLCSKTLKCSKIARIAPILTILGPFESSWRDLSFETHFVFYCFSFRTLFFRRGVVLWASFQSFRSVIQIKRKLKRKRKPKRKPGNLQGRREAPLPLRSLHPFRFRFRFKFPFTCETKWKIPKKKLSWGDFLGVTSSGQWCPPRFGNT